MGYMEPEALSFQPSGDFKVRSFAKTGPSDEVNDRYAAQARDNYARPGRIAQEQPAKKPAAQTPYQPSQLGSKSASFSNPFAEDDATRLQNAGINPLGAVGSDMFRLQFSSGTDRVPGQGSGHVDTVPAMLAPGEAVLNRAAAENFGRGNIAQLNAAGAHQMGLGMHGSDEMNDFLRSQGIGVAPQVDMTPRRVGAAPQVGGPDPSMTAWGNRPAPAPARALQPGYAANFQPPPVMQPRGPDMRSMGIGVAPPVDMTPPHIDHGPQVGIPNRRAPIPPTWDQDFVDMHGGMTPPAAMPDPNSFYQLPQPPMMQPQGMGMRPRPSLGGERARGGLSAFEQAFSTARKAGKSAFDYNGSSYNTKRADGR